MPTSIRRAVCERLILSLITAVVCVAPALATEEFTVVLLPDTQFYTEQPLAGNTYVAQTQWIKANVDTENIKFVIHLGDMVQLEQETSQWMIADAAQSVLEGDNPVPHSVVAGNHDVWGTSTGWVRSYEDYNTWFDTPRYVNQPWFGGSYGEGNESNYTYFSVGDLDFLVLSLEVMPRDNVINWAQNVVNAHPNHRIILATHAYLTPEGDRRVESSMGPLTGNDGTDIYNKLVHDNPNIFMVTCGHKVYEALNVGKNVAGKPVFEILSDYQYAPNSGDGWLRTLRFAPDENRITVGSYSPTLDQHNYSFAYTLEYDMGGVVAPPPPRPLATLKSSWSFDNDGTDGVGGNDLVLDSGATIVSGHFGNGLHANETASGFAYTGLGSGLAVSDAFSVATWVKYDAANQQFGQVFAVMTDDDNGYDFGFTEGDTASSPLAIRIIKDDVAYHVVTDAEIDRDTFHHVAFSFDDLAGPTASKKIRVWIDGLLVGVSDTNHRHGTQGANGCFVLGRAYDSETYFSGLLDEVRFYDGVLSDSQVAALQSLPVPGDANGDGAVDELDTAILAENWGETGANWTLGDFDGDGVVGLGDASILAANWGYGGAGAAIIPEPGLLTILLAGGLALCRFRSRE